MNPLTRKLQKLAKFGEVYGIGAARLRDALAKQSPVKITRKNAQRLLEAFKRKHPTVASWLSLPAAPVPVPKPLLLTEHRHEIMEMLDLLRRQKPRPDHGIRFLDYAQMFPNRGDYRGAQEVVRALRNFAIQEGVAVMPTRSDFTGFDLGTIERTMMGVFHVNPIMVAGIHDAYIIDVRMVKSRGGEHIPPEAVARIMIDPPTNEEVASWNK